MSLLHHPRPAGTTDGRKSVTIGPGWMPVLGAFLGSLLTIGTTACGEMRTAPDLDQPGGSGSAAPVVVPPPAVAPAVPPPAPQPVADGPCRYLPAAAVQTANGERVAGVRISGTGRYPACFFLAGNGTVQLRSWIVMATPEVARATVDAVAPVASSDLAELPGGWSGGSQPTGQGAVFAVSRQGTAVVITTNQRQTISARRIAEQVIGTLGL